MACLMTSGSVPEEAGRSDATRVGGMVSAERDGIAVLIDFVRVAHSTSLDLAGDLGFADLEWPPRVVGATGAK